MQGKVQSLSLPATMCMISLFCAAAVISAPAQGVFFTTLYSFCAGGYPCTDGFDPYGSLVQAMDGAFYGTTAYGGDNGSNSGTVFKITAGGALTTLHNFDVSDGWLPIAALIQATDGNFYSTTVKGGDNNAGTVYKMTATGTLTTLYSFCTATDCRSDLLPYSGLVQAADGDFYGTTDVGGAYGYGTVYGVTPGGMQTPLYSFCSQTNCPDGAYPYAGLVIGSDGNFYGTTAAGGTTNSGTVFRITPAGVLTTLYSFCAQPNCIDGVNPNAALVQATDGNFYGTTVAGGTTNSGTVFRITPAGVLTTLYSFCAQRNCADGSNPYSSLVEANDGSFYGTAFAGGNTACYTGCGVVFKITASGTLNIVHSFNYADGRQPFAGLVQARDGSFYGTTVYGGAYGNGTVFRVGLVRTCATCRP